jgi:hypothetical protein
VFVHPRRLQRGYRCRKLPGAKAPLASA